MMPPSYQGKLRDAINVMHPILDSYTDLQLGVVSKNRLILSLTNNSGSLCTTQLTAKLQTLVCLCLQPQDPPQPLAWGHVTQAAAQTDRQRVAPQLARAGEASDKI